MLIKRMSNWKSSTNPFREKQVCHIRLWARFLYFFRYGSWEWMEIFCWWKKLKEPLMVVGRVCQECLKVNESKLTLWDLLWKGSVQRMKEAFREAEGQRCFDNTELNLNPFIYSHACALSSLNEISFLSSFFLSFIHCHKSRLWRHWRKCGRGNLLQVDIATFLCRCRCWWVNKHHSRSLSKLRQTKIPSSHSSIGFKK